MNGRKGKQKAPLSQRPIVWSNVQKLIKLCRLITQTYDDEHAVIHSSQFAFQHKQMFDKF